MEISMLDDISSAHFYLMLDSGMRNEISVLRGLKEHSMAKHNHVYMYIPLNLFGYWTLNKHYYYYKHYLCSFTRLHQGI